MTSLAMERPHLALVVVRKSAGRAWTQGSVRLRGCAAAEPRQLSDHCVCCRSCHCDGCGVSGEAGKIDNMTMLLVFSVVTVTTVALAHRVFLGLCNRLCSSEGMMCLPLYVLVLNGYNRLQPCNLPEKRGPKFVLVGLVTLPHENCTDESDVSWP